MNFLHVAPTLENGGLRYYAADLAGELQQNGHHNTVLSPMNACVSALSAAKIKHFPCPKHRFFSALQIERIILTAVRRRKIHIILAYTPGTAWLAGRAIRSIEPAKRPKLVGMLTAYPRRNFASRGFLYCDAFATVSRHLRDVMQAFSPLFLSKVPWVIPYGIRDEVCNPDYQVPEEWREKWNAEHPDTSRPGDNTLKLCLPGAISPLHGLEDLIPVLTMLQRNGVRTRVYVVGDTTKAASHYLQQIKGRLTDAQLRDSVVWLGARSDLRDILCMCDATISLNHRAATDDRAILEALSLGRPVAGYDHGAVGEMLTSFLPEGRVVPGKADAMADILTQWSFCPPDTIEDIPYPYRLFDTAGNVCDLCDHLLSTP